MTWRRRWVVREEVRGEGRTARDQRRMAVCEKEGGGWEGGREGGREGEVDQKEGGGGEREGGRTSKSVREGEAVGGKRRESKPSQKAAPTLDGAACVR